jgi:uncharacterized protein
MSEKENVQLVQMGFAALGKGDVKSLLDVFTEDAEIQQPGPQNVIPYAGAHRGKARVAQFFKTLSETQEFKQFEPMEFIAQGDKVVVIGREKAHVKSTAHTYDLDWAMCFTIKGGKVAAIRIYEDTTDKVKAFKV